MSFHWSTHQLTEYLAAVSASGEEDVAIRVAVERAVEALDAEVGLLVLAGQDQVSGLVGLPPPLPASVVEPAVRGEPLVALPGLGTWHAAYASLGNKIGGLVVVREDGALSAEERQMLQGMAQVLGLALRSLRTLAVERSLRAEREREAAHRLDLLKALRGRQTLLETLLAIQRAISKREPLQSVLDAITAGASALLGQTAVALVLADPAEPTSLLITSTSHWPSEWGTAGALAASAESMAAGGTIGYGSGPATRDRLRAAPVYVGDGIAGSLVVALPTPLEPGEDLQAQEQPARLLPAFAQQISLALTDARTVEAIREAYRDAITGLPNRKLFLERLEHSLDDPATNPVVVLFIDLDRFKSVNDSLGHRAGDELLAGVAARIRARLRLSDVAARLGGDEFAVLLETASVDDARRVADRIAADIAAPFEIAGRTIYVGSSIGIAPGGVVGTDAAELLSNADVAMYRAKKVRSGQVVLFEPAMHAEVLDRLDFQVDLKKALPGSEFRLNFQPLVRLATGEVQGTEALLRWRHPTRGNVPPDVFIPVAEEIGLIGDIGRWVLGESLRQLALWRRLEPRLGVSVNASSYEIVTQRFVEDVVQALATAGLPGSALTIELTETALMTDPGTALRHLCALREAGVRISVDDFGIGYSALSYLRQFPVDQVKIDRTFVAGLGRSPQDRAVVQAIVDLSRALRLEVVAEGIEDADQLRALVGMGCHLGQGYYLHRPMEAERCGELLARTARPDPVGASDGVRSG